MLRPKRKSPLRVVLKILLGFFVLFNAILFMQAYRLTYFYEIGEVPLQKPELMTTSEKLSAALLGVQIPKKAVVYTPLMPYQTITLTDSEGLKLEGWYVPVKDAKGTILLHHGHAGTKSGIVKEANYFNELGYNTFALDARSHGNSQGNVCTIGYEEAEDVKLSYDFVKSKGEKNIILWGVSMGAAMVMKAVPAYDLKPSKIMLDCPFGSMPDAVKGRLRMSHIPESPIAEILLFYGSLIRGYWAFDYKPYEYAKGITCPVLYGWGRNDVRVTQAETDADFNNLASKDKTLVIYENSGHQSFCKNEEAKWKASVKAFLEKK